MRRPAGDGSLTDIFRRLIATHGPISLAHYMAEANARYYASRDPLGAPAPGVEKGGDFTTAPEISQMFGELLGLWLADIWVRAGRPAPVHYVELGPGRGTLALDALRAMRSAGLVPHVHLIEASPALRAIQAQGLPGARWHHDLSTLPEDAPLLVLANEFLDALPVRQMVRAEAGWRERMIDWHDDRFRPVVGTRPMDVAVPEAWREAATGAILETCPAAAAVVREAASRLARQGGAALFVDYGHALPQLGSTLQAVRAHRKVNPFLDPGEADLTALVDFATLAEVAEKAGARPSGIAEQGAFLTALGIDARVAALAARGDPAAIEAARARLVDADQMGALFKVMGFVAPEWPDGAGFA